MSNFAGNNHFITRFRFEANAVEVDSIGTCNMNVSGNFIHNNTFVKEGNSCGYASSGNTFLQKSDNDLPDNFPFKNGSSNKSCFISFWVRLPTLGGDSRYFFSKYQVNNGHRSFAIRMATNNTVAVLIGYNNGNNVDSASLKHDNTLTANNNYHIQVWFNDTSHSGKIRIYQDGVGYLNGTKTANNLPSIFTGPQELCINAQSNTHGDSIAGYYDDLVIADTDQVSEAEADLIRDDAYGASEQIEAEAADVTNLSTQITAIATKQGLLAETLNLADEAIFPESAVSYGTSSQATKIASTAQATKTTQAISSDTISLDETASTISTIVLDAAFDGGNANADGTLESPANTINVYPSRDTAGRNWCDWFYFKLTGVYNRTLSVKVHYTHLVNPTYWSADHGHVRPVWSYDGITWNRLSSITSYSDGLLTFALPTLTENTLYVAMDHPYTYTDLLSDIATWETSPFCTATVLSYSGVSASQGGRNVYHLRIENTDSQYSNKLHIVMTCRSHPGEPQASHALKGLIDWILSSETEAVKIRNKCILDIFPMTNPDGVYHGRTRAYDDGTDGNRQYDEVNGPSTTYEPNETFLIHYKINEIHDTVNFCIDLHSSNWTTIRLSTDKDVTGDNYPTGPVWSTTLQSNIMTALNNFDTDNYWYNSASLEDYAASDGAWRIGQTEQYDYAHLLVEGGIYTDSSGAYPTIAQRQAGGVALLRTVVSTLEDTLVYANCAETVNINTPSGKTATFVENISTAMNVQSSTDRLAYLYAVINSPLSITSSTNRIASYIKTISSDIQLSSEISKTTYLAATILQALMLSDISDYETLGISFGICNEQIHFTTDAAKIAEMLSLVTTALTLSSQTSYGAAIAAILETVFSITSTDERYATLRKMSQDSFTVADEDSIHIIFQLPLLDVVTIGSMITTLKTVATDCSDVFNIQSINYWINAEGKVTITFTLHKGSITFESQ